LVRRAEAGDEIILTRHGKAAVRFVAMKTISQKRILHAQVKAGMLRMAFCIGVWVFVRTSFAKLAERGSVKILFIYVRYRSQYILLTIEKKQ
jgi:hypothetical protein